MRNYKFSISEQIEKAKLSMSNGSFPSKAAQKDVMGDLNRAYSQAIDAKSYDALEAAGYSYIDVPFDLHQVRPRHEEIFKAGGIDWDTVTKLIELRNEAKAMEIVKPAPRPISEPTGNQATHRGTCQICGSSHKVNNKTGRIATHGYNTDRGFFQGECVGRYELPLEKSCDFLKEVATKQKKYAEVLMQKPDEIHDERKPNVTHKIIAQRIYRFVAEAEKVIADWKPAELMKVAA